MKHNKFTMRGLDFMQVAHHYFTEQETRDNVNIVLSSLVSPRYYVVLSIADFTPFNETFGPFRTKKRATKWCDEILASPMGEHILSSTVDIMVPPGPVLRHFKGHEQAHTSDEPEEEGFTIPEQRAGEQ